MPEIEAEAHAPEERSVDASVDRAFEKAFPVEAETPADTPEAPEEQVEVKSDDRPRGPDGKFIAKEASDSPAAGAGAAMPEPGQPLAPVQQPQPTEQPKGPDITSRFAVNPAAKADWATVPESVKGEVSRVYGEMEKGLAQYRAQWEPIRQFAERAEREGTTIQDAMAHYAGLEDLIRQNPLGGLDRICQNLGTTLRDVAAHVLGQPAPEKDAQVTQLTGQMREMQARLQRYEAQERRQQEQAYNDAVERVTQFSASHPRFADLQGTIKWLLETKGASDLDEAYEIADRLRPAPTPPVAAQTRPEVPPPAAQTRKVGISIEGAPGSNPATRAKSRNASEAVDRAFDQLGL